MAKKRVTTIKKSSVTVKGSNSAKVVDVIKVYGKKNTVKARNGNDQITVFRGSGHKISGGAGNDRITVKKGNNLRINGDSGKDRISLSAGKKDVIRGGAGNDTIIVTGGSGNIIYGNTGKDTFVFGKTAKATIKDYKPGQDTLQVSGGMITGTKLSGRNVIFTSGKSRVTLANASGKKISIKDSRGSYTASNTEIRLGKNFSGTMDARKFLATVTRVDGRSAVKSVNITGNAGNNTIYAGKAGGTVLGGTGNDKLIGGAGNDRLEGGAGNDTLTGGKGWDTFVYASGHDTITDYDPDEDTLQFSGQTILSEAVVGNDVVLELDSGTLRLQNAAGKYQFLSGNTVLINGDSAVLGEEFYGSFDASGKESIVEIDAGKATLPVTIIGNANNNTITGGKSFDTLEGGAGDDTLNGGESANTLTGGIGNDTFVYGLGYDTITDYTNNGNETDTLRIEGALVSNVWQYDDVVRIDISNGGYMDLEGAAGSSVRIEDNHGVYSVSGIASNKDITVHSINSEGCFDASDLGFAKVINAADMEQNITVIGNANDNVIYGGKAGSVLTGGQGNDIFVHSVGYDTVTDYTNNGSEADVLRIEGAVVSDAAANGNDAVLTLARGSVTLTDAADKAIKVEDTRGSYTITTLTSEPKIVLGEDYTGSSFDAASLSFVQTVDATDVTRAMVVTGNANDNIIYAGKGGTSLDGGAGNDRLIVDGKYNDTLTGGIGSDTYVISKKLASDTVLTIDQNGYRSGDADTLRFEKINKEDVRYSLQDNVLSIMHSSGGTIAVTDWDTNPLTSVRFANGSVSKAEINDGLATHSTQSVTQQSVIKSFMKALADSTMIVESAESALNAAVKFASNYKFSTWSGLIEGFISDIRTFAAESKEEAKSFLRTYCGIDLDNEDIGAITGADAGGSVVKTAISIVPENGSMADAIAPTGATTINGLTFEWPSEVADEKEQAIVKAINTWWAKEGLDLVEESYGLSFNEEGTMVSDMNVEFYSSEYSEDGGKDSTLAVVYYSSDSNGVTKKLTLKVNMANFENLDINDVNGYAGDSSCSLDRVIAHEFTHAVMAANITGFKRLPHCLVEGSAELVHGIDDFRTSTIIALAKVQNSDELSEALSDMRPNYKYQINYAGGYMLLRYFAKQVADSFSGNASSSPMLAGSAADALYAFSTDFAATSDSVLLSEHRDSDSSMLPRVMGSFANNSMDEWKTKR